MLTVLPARPRVWIFFASFIVVAVFVVINNPERAKEAERFLADAVDPDADVLARIDAIRDELGRLEQRVRGWT